jgi:phenylalanyl-tRNA synthetase alpha subunit
MERLMAAATHEEREQERARLEAALSLERERFQAERLEQEQRLEKRLEESEARLKEEVMERDRQLAELAEEKERLEERFKEERDQLQERLNALQQKLGKMKTWPGKRFREERVHLPKPVFTQNIKIRIWDHISESLAVLRIRDPVPF